MLSRLFFFQQKMTFLETCINDVSTDNFDILVQILTESSLHKYLECLKHKNSHKVPKWCVIHCTRLQSYERTVLLELTREDEIIIYQGTDRQKCPPGKSRTPCLETLFLFPLLQQLLSLGLNPLKGFWSCHNALYGPSTLKHTLRCFQDKKDTRTPSGVARLEQRSIKHLKEQQMLTMIVCSLF